MNAATELRLFDGPAGILEVAIDRPSVPVRGCALIAHPHPLQGGTRDNKVAQTLARAALACGLVSWRPNFRGVGGSTGTHDDGRGETDDLLSLAARLREAEDDAPLLLAGFSFGAYVQTRVAAALAASSPARHLALVGPAVGRFDLGAVDPRTTVIHGALDDVVPLQQVLDWARPLELPVLVFPGADHFFHRRLTQLKSVLTDAITLRMAS